MNYKLSITLEAEEDLKETYLWYESKRKGLGHDFLLQVDAKLQLIERDPLLFTEQYKGVRCSLTKRFPYKILYHTEGQNIIVIAVIYGGRSPKWMKQRIRVSKFM
ncbi:MAG: type II toxin-antitoxin system RelE/ParE family toxin [Thermodesulfobacteriota bacterium]|nr:type II toxin-antitoxin system RelE/ParE family toxin [Thermodesulfobacteriota bacterium]